MGLSNRGIMDLREYPTHIAMHAPNTRVALGDLHGNVVKCIHCLLQEGLIHLSEVQYQAIVDLYYNEKSDATTTPNEITRFKTLLDTMTATPQTSSVQLLLIGDELCDRGKNDALTLLLFQKLTHIGLKRESVLSNHSMEFLKQYALGLTETFEPRYHRTQVTSLAGLKQSIKKNAINESELNNIAQEHYLNTLKFITYDHSHANREIVLYSHIPITLKKIKIICNEFNIPCNLDSIQHLKKTIDLLNNTLHEAIQNKERFSTFLQTFNKKNKTANQFIQERYEEAIADHQEQEQTYPYYIINVHGHVGTRAKEVLAPKDQKKMKNMTYCNIDSALGQSLIDTTGGYISWIQPADEKTELILDSENNTLLCYATLQNDPLTIDHLLHHQLSDINHQNNKGISAVFIALKNDSVLAAEKLLAYKPNLSLTHEGKSLNFIKQIIHYNSMNILDFLIKHAIYNLYIEQAWEKYTLHALNNNKLNIARKIVDHYCLQKRGYTPSTWAIKHRAHALFILLDYHNADYNLSGYSNVTPLQIAYLVATDTDNADDFFLSILVQNKNVSFSEHRKEVLTHFIKKLNANNTHSILFISLIKKMIDQLDQPDLQKEQDFLDAITQIICTTCALYNIGEPNSHDLERSYEKILHLIEEKQKMTRSNASSITAREHAFFSPSTNTHNTLLTTLETLADMIHHRDSTPPTALQKT